VEGIQRFFLLPVREAENYRYLATLNIPIPRLLAYGDVRHCFILQESFIVVDFIPESSDGTVFMPGGKQREELTLAEEFTKKNFELLAKVHQHNFYHKAFHLRNSLFRHSADGNLEVFWIDVARCRMWPKPDMSWPIIHDLYTWLKDICFEESVGLRCLEHYCRFNPQCPLSAAELLAALQKFRRRSGANAVNVFAQ
ncbi:MAG: lipopolysaccharide kinase InaA family protein, partial [Victivallaceae bacterium]